MRSGSDRLPHRQGAVIQQIAQVTPLAGGLQAQLLIEITIEQATLPIDAHETAAHHRLEIVGVVSLDQQLLIGPSSPCNSSCRAKRCTGMLARVSKRSKRTPSAANSRL